MDKYIFHQTLSKYRDQLRKKRKPGVIYVKLYSVHYAYYFVILHVEKLENEFSGYIHLKTSQNH